MREGITVEGIHRKSQFKSKLMIGAAGFAVAGMGTAAAAADQPSSADAPKWLPYASVGGQVGDGVSGAKVDLFVPVWQDLNSLLFARIGVGTQTRDDEIANFGIGYRTKVDPSWILGVYGGVDASHTKYGHTFTQGALGAELMSADWDLRINGYLATQKEAKDIAGRYALYIHDTQIAIMQGQEAAYSGFDGEVGYRVFSTDNTDFRVYAGGFSFSRDPVRTPSTGQTFNIDYRDIQGPYGRAEVDIYDIDALGAQSRITVTGQISHDDVRGTSGYVGASLRIPLGAGWGQGGQALDELDRRMVDQVRRQDNVLTQWRYSKPEPVIIYNGSVTSEPTNTLYYVDNTVGAGSYADPTTPQDATSRTSTNAFIVATDFDGPIVASGTVLQPGQRLVAPGTFNVRGIDSSRVFTHDFAPGSGTPTFTAASPTDNVLTLAANTVVDGINFSGPFNAAIYGHNVDDVEINNVTIDGSAGGSYGILINQDMSQDMNLHISNSTITDLGVDGVAVNTNVSDGGTSNQNIEITNSTISGSGVADIALATSVSGGSTVNQSILIDPTVISGGLYGVGIYDYVIGGTLNQAIALSDVTFSGQTYSGIAVGAYAGPGGTINQTIALDHVTVTGSYAPIAFVGAAYYDGVVNQTIDLSNVTATGATYDENISVRGWASYGGTVNQSGAWTNITATGGADDGVEFGADVQEGGSVIQNFAISGLTATGNYDAGVDIYGTAFHPVAGYGYSIVAQYVSIDSATITGNYAGVYAQTSAFGPYAATRQDLMVSNSTITGNYTGLEAVSVAILNGSSQQNVALLGDTVDSNLYDGARFVAEGLIGGFAAQYIYIGGSSFSNNGEDGMDLLAAGIAGGNAEQDANIYYSTFDGNGLDGLHIETTSAGYALGYYAYFGQTTQNVIAAYDSFSHNHGDGVHVYNYAAYGGQLNQFLYFFGDRMVGNGGSGVREISDANAYGYYGYAIPTNLYSDLYVVASTADGNHVDGIAVSSTIDGPGYLIQHIDVAATDASYNGRTGFVDYANAYDFYSLNIQYITLAGSRFDGNGLDGAAFLASQYYGPLSFGAAIQDVTIASSDFSGNYRDGLYARADASGLQGRVEQHFTVAYSYFDYNGANGIELRNGAHDGVYLPGYGCGQVQGLYGGCAFVRQTLAAYGSHLDYNGNDGLYISNLAANYGAIYATGGRPAHVPTVFLYGSTLNGNGHDGMELVNYATDASYLYQYVLAVDTQFNNNGAFGIEGHNYASGGSQLIQIVTLYSYNTGTTVDGNGAGGVQITSYSDGGYSFNSAMINQLNLIGVDVSHNGGNGVGMAMVSYATYVAVQNLNAYYSSFVGNTGYGAGVLSAGYGDFYNEQTVHAAGNVFAYNGLIGLGVGQYDFHSVYADQTVAAARNVFVDNAVGFAQASYLVDTYAGSQTSVLAANYFTGGNATYGGIGGDGASVVFLTNNVHYGYATQIVAGNTFKNVANDALSIRVGASAYSYVYDYTYVAGNMIDGAGGSGIRVDLSASDYSLLTNNAAISPYGVVIAGNGVSNAGMTYGGNGIDVLLSAGHYGAIVGNASGGLAPFAVYVAGNTVDTVYGHGIDVGTNNYEGLVYAGFGVVGNTVSNVAGYGIIVDSYNYGGLTGQASLISNNTVANAYLGGIFVNNEMHYGLSITENQILNNTVSGAVTYAGINIVDHGDFGTLDDLTYVVGNAVSDSYAGIGMYTYGDNSVQQVTYVSGNTLTNNGYGVVGKANDTTAQYIQTYGLNTQIGTPPANYYYFYAAPGATQIVL